MFLRGLPGLNASGEHELIVIKQGKNGQVSLGQTDYAFVIVHIYSFIPTQPRPQRYVYCTKIYMELNGKKGYGLVSARSQPYRTRPEAECDTAGLTQIPGRIRFLRG